MNEENPASTHRNRQLAMGRKRRDTYQTDEEFDATRNLLRAMRESDDRHYILATKQDVADAIEALPLKQDIEEAIEALPLATKQDVAEAIQALPLQEIHLMIKRVDNLMLAFNRLAEDDDIGLIMRTMTEHELKQH